MIEESMSQAWEQIKSVAWALVRIIGVTIAAGLLLRLTMDDSQLVIQAVTLAATFWGAVMFFLSDHMTGKNFWVRAHGTFHWVDTATPAPVWKIAAYVLWSVAAGCAVVGWLS